MISWKEFRRRTFYVLGNGEFNGVVSTPNWRKFGRRLPCDHDHRGAIELLHKKSRFFNLYECLDCGASWTEYDWTAKEGNW